MSSPENSDGIPDKQALRWTLKGLLSCGCGEHPGLLALADRCDLRKGHTRPDAAGLIVGRSKEAGEPRLSISYG
jgi:hypothetical protein